MLIWFTTLQSTVNGRFDVATCIQVVCLVTVHCKVTIHRLDDRRIRVPSGELNALAVSTQSSDEGQMKPNLLASSMQGLVARLQKWDKKPSWSGTKMRMYV